MAKSGEKRKEDNLNIAYNLSHNSFSQSIGSEKFGGQKPTNRLIFLIHLLIPK